MMKIRLRAIAFTISLLMLFESTGFAAAEFKPAELVLFPTPAVTIQFPKSVATVGEVWRADPRSNILVYLIQDAHMNESGQLNISRALEQILKEKKVDRVFLEGAFSNNSLAFLRKEAPLSKRQEVAKQYLRQGILSGSEYLDLTSNADFLPTGVEDWDLYWKSVKAYEKVAKGREKTTQYLANIENTLNTLKPRIFSLPLLSFDRKREDYLKEKISLSSPGFQPKKAIKFTKASGKYPLSIKSCTETSPWRLLSFCLFSFTSKGRCANSGISQPNIL